jgi:hypothetical protein
LASRHEEFLAAGARVFAVSIDSPEQNAAMVEKLSVPFPMLSDPDRSGLIEPLGLADAKDARNISKPAMVLIAPDGSEAWRFVSRDYADRLPNDEVIDLVRSMELAETSQHPPDIGPAAPGAKAMPFEGLFHYIRGARFAAQAIGLRHKDLGDEIKEDSKAYVAEMDEMLEAITALTKRRNA